MPSFMCTDCSGDKSAPKLPIPRCSFHEAQHLRAELTKRDADLEREHRAMTEYKAGYDAENRRLREANEELRIALEGELVFGRIDGTWRCKDCMVIAAGDPGRAGHAPKPYPHHERCILRRAALSESTDGGQQ